ncbi:tRNA lysidine(34) synthetase TilS [Aquisalimonas sp.]|uniref:tRNA lysidine(34) synthetase TilS n=1 Tax=Aquisalimonas sp. TaxID=1872621 RepID=UPI0025BD7D8F|nr:tRNA lysidine(34) synthetase TilS [Aquisalimonas sp.]
MTITAEGIADRVLALGKASAYCVAFSGGPDSHALLHALAAVRTRLPAPLRAMHVNHGLHAQAPDWAAHCEQVSRLLHIPLVVAAVTGRPPADAGETWAREQRYRLFSARLVASEMLLTAHHQDDQAETVLLRLLRGAGVDGLGGIPQVRALGCGWVGRPLLDVPRSALQGYALRNDLRSLRDPGNDDLAADRNFLRHRVLPLIAERWPQADRSVSRAGALLREGRGLLERYALSLERGARRGEQLRCKPLRQLAPEEQRLVLRQWLRQQGLPLPDARQLEAGCAMLIQARADRTPEFLWPGGRVRRFRDALIADAGRSSTGNERHPRGATWHGDRDLRLDGGWLRVLPGRGGLDPATIPADGFAITYRAGGERCRPAGRPSRPLKKLFQEAGVPHWDRFHWPLLAADEGLAVIPGICVCEGYQAPRDQQGLMVIWEQD